MPAIMSYNTIRNRPCRWINEYRCRFFYLEQKSTQLKNFELTIRKDIHKKAIQVNIQSSGIEEEEQIYILPDDEIDGNQ